MDAFRWLEIGANVASIITAIVAAWADVAYLYRRRQKRLRLENYLRIQTADNDSLRGLTHQSAELGMTEAEIIDVAFRSRHIVRLASPAMASAPSRLLFRYIGKKSN